MAQFNIKNKPINYLLAGYNNESTANATLIVGSKIKLTTCFAGVIGSNTLITGGPLQSSFLSVGHRNAIHNSNGLLIGSDCKVLPSNNVYLFGNNINVTSGVSNAFVVGNNIVATNSNSFTIGGDLIVSGAIYNNSITGVQGATGPQGATGNNGIPGTATNYTPTSSQDTKGNVGDITYDTSYLYVKTGQGWLRTSLSSFQSS